MDKPVSTLRITSITREENEEMESYLDTKKEDKSYWEQQEKAPRKK